MDEMYRLKCVIRSVAFPPRWMMTKLNVSNSSTFGTLLLTVGSAPIMEPETKTQSANFLSATTAANSSPIARKCSSSASYAPRGPRMQNSGAMNSFSVSGSRSTDGSSYAPLMISAKRSNRARISSAMVSLPTYSPRPFKLE